jgi:hypothetical protein
LQRKHALLCGFIKREQTSDAEDSQTDVSVFRPVIEQVGFHRMKKCSGIIREDRRIEQAIKKECKSILLPGLFGRSYRLIKLHFFFVPAEECIIPCIVYYACMFLSLSANVDVVYIIILSVH